MESATMDRPTERASKRSKSPARRAASSPKEGSAPKGARKGRGKKMHNRELGQKGEEAAARFLLHRGYDIIERNWRCAAGEADIVALDGDTVVFVEVKTRADASKGFPAEAVTAKRRDRYERIACLYLQEHDFADVMLRFDVVAILVMPPDRAVVRHHINAWLGEER